MVDKYIFTLAFVLNIGIKKELFISLNKIFDEYSKSKSLASLNQYIGHVYDDLGYDEDPPPSLPRTNTT